MGITVKFNQFSSLCNDYTDTTNDLELTTNLLTDLPISSTRLTVCQIFVP
jgi:hypothetical protein